MTSTPEQKLTYVLAQRFGEAPAIEGPVEGVEALIRMAEHSSHRKWQERPVPESLVRLLAACALSAPSKSDLQQASLIDVRDPAQRAAIADLLPQFPWLPGAPAFLVFCADGSRLRRIFAQHDAPFVNEHLDQFFNAVVDGSLVMMAFMQAASAAGLVHCPISMIRNQPARLDEILGLPGHVVPIAGLCLGYPVYGGRIVPRLPLSLTVHRDRYSTQDTLPLLDAYDARRRATEQAARPPAAAGAPANPPWTQAKRRQYSELQRADWGAYVRAKGFDTR